jgi:hypothetical protein
MALTPEQELAAKEAAEKAAAEEAERVAAAKTDEPTLDSVIKDGKPVTNESAEAILAKEEAAINAEIDAKPPVIKDGKKVVEKEEPEDVITPEFRAKYKIKDTIKTMKDYAAWGENAERYANQQKAELDKKLKEISDSKTEERFKALQDKLDALAKPAVDPKATEEEKAIKAEKLRWLRENDEVGYLEAIKEEIRQEALTEKQKNDEKVQKEYRSKIESEQLETYNIDRAIMLKEYEDRGEKEVFLNEVFPELAKIAIERENLGKPLHFIGDAYAIYSQRKAKAEAKAASEDAAKRKEKEALASEASRASGAGDESGDKAMSQIQSAKSEDDLDKTAKKLGIM